MTKQPSTERFVYYVPIPPVVVGIELAFALFLVSTFLYIPYSWGLQHTLQSMHDDPMFWLVLIAIFGPMIAFLGFLAFPPKSWLTRLEVLEDRLRLVPRLLSRWIGEATTEMPTDEGNEEILIWRGSSHSIPYGFRVSVPPGGGQRQELKIESGMRLSKQQAAILVDGITGVTGLPVRLVQQTSGVGGSTHEVPWAPEGRFAFSRALAMLAFGLLPWIGGIVTGFLGTGAAVAAVVGACLWLSQTASLLIYARLLDQKSRFPKIRWLTTVFTFTASYMVAYALTVFLVHR